MTRPTAGALALLAALAAPALAEPVVITGATRLCQKVRLKRAISNR